METSKQPMHRIQLKPGKEESLKRFHPWVFSGAIARIEGKPEEGEIVEVRTAQDKFIAKGHYQIGSIAVRVLTFDPQEDINADFWRRRLAAAYALRRSIGLTERNDNNTYRLICSDTGRSNERACRQCLLQVGKHTTL